MAHNRLQIVASPELDRPRMLLGFTGWMDGGDVSTGTIKELVRTLGARELAAISPEGFYIYNFPGSMELSALFRPHVKIEDGLIAEYHFPDNVFHYDVDNRLILFRGKEPNLNWEDYADCIFTLASEFGVETIYFIGSVAGAVPHTRDPRMYSSVSDAVLKDQIAPYVVRFSNYEGPGSFITYLTRLAPSHGARVVSLVAEIPAYVDGTNPRCIEGATRTLAAVLGLGVDLDSLRATSDAFEARVNEAVADRDELTELIQRLESEYDNDMFESQMGDLKHWLEQKGIRLD